MSFDQRILEVRGGQATPASISLTVGTPLTPVSIGSEGMWRVQGPGTLPIHAYVYFDGTVLFVQSADDAQPVTINRKKVSTTWTEVNCPSALELGGISILYQLEQEFEGDPATVATPIEEIAQDMRDRGLLPPSAPSLVDPEPATVMSGEIKSFQGLAPMRVPPVPGSAPGLPPIAPPRVVRCVGRLLHATTRSRRRSILLITPQRNWGTSSGARRAWVVCRTPL